jgi:hypothetical protein
MPRTAATSAPGRRFSPLERGVITRLAWVGVIAAPLWLAAGWALDWTR